MSSDYIHKLGGSALFFGGIVSVITFLYGDVAFQGFRTSFSGDPLWSWVNLLSLIAGILVVLGFTATYARQYRETGTLGLWGWVLGFVADLLFSVVTALFLLAVPLLSAEDKKLFDFAGGTAPPPSLGLFFGLATLIFIVGAILYGLATNRAAIFPRWTGWGFIVSGVLAILTTVIRLVLPSFNPVLADSPFILFSVVAVAMGYWLGMLDVAPEGTSSPANT